MKWCRCVTKPFLIGGLCQLCKLEAAPHDERSEDDEFEFEIIFEPDDDELDVIFQPA